MRDPKMHRNISGHRMTRGGWYSTKVKARAEAERKLEHLDVEKLGEQEVPQLVHEDEWADEQDEVEQGHLSVLPL